MFDCFSFLMTLGTINISLIFMSFLGKASNYFYFAFYQLFSIFYSSFERGLLDDSLLVTTSVNFDF